MGILNNSSSTDKESSFNLAFSIEVLIVVKIELPTMRIEHYEEPSNSSWLIANMDLLKETQTQVYLIMAMYR